MNAKDDKSVLVGLEGWSGFFELIPGNSKKTPSLQVNFKRSGNYTIQFSVAYPDVTSEATALFATLAEVTWTVEGNFVRRVMSLFNGSAISGTGQAVRVRFLDFCTPEIEYSGTYQVAVQVAPGTRPAEQGPILFLNTDANLDVDSRRGVTPTTTVAAGTSQDFDIPQDPGLNALIIYYALAEAVVPDLHRQVVDGVSVAIGASFGSAMVIGGDMLNKWFPLPPDAKTITITNSSLLSLQFTPIFATEG